MPSAHRAAIQPKDQPPMHFGDDITRSSAQTPTFISSGSLSTTPSSNLYSLQHTPELMTQQSPMSSVPSMHVSVPSPLQVSFETIINNERIRVHPDGSCIKMLSHDTYEVQHFGHDSIQHFAPYIKAGTLLVLPPHVKTIADFLQLFPPDYRGQCR